MERGRLIQYLVAFALSLSTAALGTLSAWPTPVMPKFHNNQTSVEITKNEIATMLAMSPPGFVVGSLATRFISDSLGRRATVLASALPIVCGTIIAAFARVAWLLCIMKFLWGFGTGMVSTIIDQELELMKRDVSKEMRNSSSAWEFFTGKQYRRPIMIAFGLKLTQVLTGGMSIQQYMGLITQEIGLDVGLSTLLIIFGAVKFFVGIMSSTLVDRVGRRPLLIYSFFGTGISLSVAGTYFFLQEYVRVDHAILKSYGIAAFVAIILSNGISTLGFNSIIGIISAEIFPLNIKTVAMTSLNVFGGCLGFSVAKSYQAINNVSGFYGVFWIFASSAFLGAIFSYIAVPETKGKSLREIQEILQIGTACTEEESKLNDVQVVEMIEKCRDIKESKKDSSL
ncbi:jg16022 [Pararge aegeria aegeria]|uniref:Jg16022 protein n=1 Tax=Pararge aegeria aegeria TaxID=348720 RepID=A0A8S4SMW1_9NEOP|nr:jg16022 [Pararge aegeria aegeria]